MRTSRKEAAEMIGKKTYGRVFCYDRKTGKGVVRTADERDFFLSSYQLGALESKIVIGSSVEFEPLIYGKMVVASAIRIIEKYPAGVNGVYLPNGEYVPLSMICKVGVSNGLYTSDVSRADLERKGYTVKDLDYVFVRTGYGEYRFPRIGSPVKCDGQVDIDEFMKEMKRIILGEE